MSNFWLLVTTLILLILILLAIGFILFPARDIRSNVERIEDEVKPLHSKAEDLFKHGEVTVKTFGNFAIKAVSDISEAEKDYSKTDELTESFLGTAQADFNNFIFDLCNMDLQDPARASLKYPVRQGKNMVTLCQNVPDLPKHRSLVIKDGLTASKVFLALLKIFGIPLT